MLVSRAPTPAAAECSHLHIAGSPRAGKELLTYWVESVSALLCCAVLCCAVPCRGIPKCTVLHSSLNIAYWVLYSTVLSLNRVAGAILTCCSVASFILLVCASFLHAVLQVEDLKRFMPQIIHIVQPGLQPAATANKNVGSAKALTDIFYFAG